MKESDEDRRAEQPQPLQSAPGSETSELSQLQAEAPGSAIECEGDGKEPRSGDREEVVTEETAEVTEIDGKDSSFKEDEGRLSGSDELVGENGEEKTVLVVYEKRSGSAEEVGRLLKVMRKNIEENGLVVDERLNEERPESAAKDEGVSLLQEELVEKDDKDLLKKEEIVPAFDEVMLDKAEVSVEEKVVNEETMEDIPESGSVKENLQLSSLKEEPSEVEDKVPLSGGVSAVKDEEVPIVKEEQGEMVERGSTDEKEEKIPVFKEEAAEFVEEELARMDGEVLALKGEEIAKHEEESSSEEEADEMDVDEGGPAMAAGRRTASQRKVGRPRGAHGRRVRGPPKPKDDEELCFICFDGGDLVVCDHRGCPKVYHPACVNRDMAYFRAKGQWNCGWHICSKCQKSARFMCYTCTYSLCKRCIKDAEFTCIRGNKGLCETCMPTVMLIETNKREDGTTVNADFDDKSSWLYLFKDYWVDLKAKLRLTLEELTTGNPFKVTPPVPCNLEFEHASEDRTALSVVPSRRSRENISVRKKGRKRLRKLAEEDIEVIEDARASARVDIEWASRELLEFVASVKNGDKSVLSKHDVQSLILGYIKENNLRDPRKKSQVNCDTTLQTLFGKSSVGHIEMLKLLEPHFLIKETSPLVTDDNQGGVVDPDSSQMDVDGNNDASTKITPDLRLKSRRVVKEREPARLDDYAAIDVHNVSLMYLRRNLMEELLDNIDSFGLKILGAFVRIRIIGSQDMYRLVQIVGIGKAAGKYKVGKKLTDITLKILNLNKREFITMDTISNQEFTEEECRRLRQSVKCGFVGRLTVAEVREKARALQSARVNDWFESERSKLSNLRDRASEQGRKKEHRECVEKLHLLSKPEERVRRLNEDPEVHADPKMDPGYDSTEDDVYAKKQVTDNNRLPKSSINKSNEFSAGKGGRKSSDVPQDTVVSTAAQSSMDCRTDELIENKGNSISHVINSQTPNTESNTTPAGTGNQKEFQPSVNPGHPSSTTAQNSQSSINPGQPASTSAQTAPQPLLANAALSNSSETEKVWRYQDPSGKDQGPFSMAQLRKWSTNGFFPSNLRVWRTSEKQEDSVLLTDALSGKIHREPQRHEPQNSTATPTNVASMVNSSQSDNPRPAINYSQGNSNATKFDSRTNMGPADPRDGRTRTSGWDSLNNSNTHPVQTRPHNNSRPFSPPYSRNSSQPYNSQNRDGRREYTSRWDGNRDRDRDRRQHDWNSNRPRKFQHNGGGSDRQHHQYRSSSSQEMPREQWRMQPTNVCPNQVRGSSFNMPPQQMPPHNLQAMPPQNPQASNIDWAGLQGAINRILPPAATVPPMNAGLNVIPPAPFVQQCVPNLTVPTMNSAVGWAPNTAPNVNAANTQQIAGVSSNCQMPNMQSKPSENAAPVTSGSQTADASYNKQNLEPNGEQAPAGVLNSGNKSDKLDPESEKNLSVADNKSASDKEKSSVSAAEPSAASDAPNASASSNVPAASVPAQKAEASCDSKLQPENQCWAPVLAHQQVQNGLTGNPSQPVNMGWGMTPQMPNPPMPGATNMGWGMMPQGMVNMGWGAPSNMNMGWGAPASATMNPNMGMAVPPQGNPNANLAWGAQMQANPNAGWGVPMQGMGQGNMNNMAVAWDPSGGNPNNWSSQQQQQQAANSQPSQGGGNRKAGGT